MNLIYFTSDGLSLRSMRLLCLVLCLFLCLFVSLFVSFFSYLYLDWEQTRGNSKWLVGVGGVCGQTECSEPQIKHSQRTTELDLGNQQSCSGNWESWQAFHQSENKLIELNSISKFSYQMLFPQNARVHQCRQTWFSTMGTNDARMYFSKALKIQFFAYHKAIPCTMQKHFEKE